MKMSKETRSSQVSSIRSTCIRNLKTCLSLKGKSTLKYSDTPRDNPTDLGSFVSPCHHGYKGPNFQKVFKELIPPITWLSPPPSLQPSWDAVCCPLVEKRCYWLRKRTNTGLKSHRHMEETSLPNKSPRTHRHIPKVNKTGMHHRHSHGGSPVSEVTFL